MDDEVPCIEECWSDCTKAMLYNFHDISTSATQSGKMRNRVQMLSQDELNELVIFYAYQKK